MQKHKQSRKLSVIGSLHGLFNFELNAQIIYLRFILEFVNRGNDSELIGIRMLRAVVDVEVEARDFVATVGTDCLRYAKISVHHNEICLDCVDRFGCTL